MATVRAADQIRTDQINFFVFCVNTYNWAPVRGVKNYIKYEVNLKDWEVVTIAIGSRITEIASRLLQELIIKEGANLMASKQYWLMRPNGESGKGDSNVEIACKNAYLLGAEIAAKLNNE